MKSKKNSVILILTLTILATGCSDSPFSPPAETNPPGSKTIFGLVEVTIIGIGTDQMKASAKSVQPGTAYNFTEPANGDGNGDGSIQMEPLTNSSFTYGVRGSGGVRYISATFKVRNAESGGNNYDTPRDNLTFMAVDDGTTYGHTAVVNLRLFDGTPLASSQAANMAETIIPTGNVGYSGGAFIPLKADVLQVLTETESGAITAPSGVDVFPFGFITTSPDVTPGSRQLLPFPAVSQFDGIVTFAFKIPLQAQANQDPFEITMLFLPVDDSEVRFTQSLEEQTPGAAAAIAARAAQLNAVYVSLLPGNLFTAAAPTRRLCGPVRVAGIPPPATPVTVLFPAPPVLQSIVPDPYAPDGSAVNIPASTTFSATYDIAVQAANANNFVVRGAQSGRHFTGGGYTTSAATVSTSTGSYFPGELVEVTLTPGLGSCVPTVTRYRVEVAGGSGVFNETTEEVVGEYPQEVTAGDWDGDGDLDLAVTNGDDDTISLLENDGAGGFSETTVPVGDFPFSVTAGDWDGDGDLGLAVTNVDDNTISLLENDGAGFFTGTSTVLIGHGVGRITTGDWEGDGDLDIAVVNGDDDTISLLENDGAGAFSETTVPVGGFPFSVTAGDWDGDGDLDLVVGNSLGDNVSLLANDGDGGFTGTLLGTGNGPGSVTAGDWDGDGDLDLAVANYSSDTVSLLENQ